MNENIFNTLDAIDEVKSSALDTQLDVLFACDNAYGKYCTFAESYQGDVDDLSFFTEGSVGEEYKKMKGENENAVITILAALPRFIAAIIKSVFSKSDDTTKKIAELEKDKKFKSKLAKAVEVVTGEGEESERVLDKLKGALKKWCKISVIAGVGGGILLHFKPAKAMDEYGEKNDKVTTAEGIEVCVDKNGNIRMTNEFLTKMDKLGAAIEAARVEIINGSKDIDKLTEKLKVMEAEIIDMGKVGEKYDGKKAADVGLTGIKGIIGKLKASLKDVDQAATRIGANLKSKAEDKGGIAKPAVALIDRVLRSGTTILSKMIDYCYSIIQAIWAIISMPFAAIKEFFTKNDPDHKKSDAEKAADAIAKDHSSKTKGEPKNPDGENPETSGGDDSENSDNSTGDSVKTDSAVEEVPEGETVTQESATVEETETSEPVDPVVSYWYNK